MLSYLRYAMIILVIIILTFIITACATQKPKYKIEFLDEVCIVPYDEYNYLVCDDTEVQINDFGIVIPEGFETDLATIPRWYWSFLSPHNTKLVAPAILHDYLYVCDYGFTKKEIDQMFLTTLFDNNLNYRTAYTMYFMVRLFGRTHHHPYSEANCTPAFDFE